MHACGSTSCDTKARASVRSGRHDSGWLSRSIRDCDGPHERGGGPRGVAAAAAASGASAQAAAVASAYASCTAAGDSAPGSTAKW